MNFEHFVIFHCRCQLLVDFTELSGMLDSFIMMCFGSMFFFNYEVSLS